MQKNSFFDQLFKYESCVFIIVICASLFIFHFELSLKLDTLVIVIGNFLIAYFIAQKINRSLKNDELIINSCFKEFDFFKTLIDDLRKVIQNIDKNSKEEMNDQITRLLSLILLQIDIIKQYDFIEQKYKDKLFKEYQFLDAFLTGENEINLDYKLSLLQLERIMMTTKSSVLLKY